MTTPNSKMKYLICIPLPTQEATFFRAIRQKLEEGRPPSTPPHVTLIPPFSTLSIKHTLNKLEDWAELQDAFKSSFTQVGHFEHAKYNTFYLSPKNPEPFVNLHQSLSETVVDIPAQDPFIPHLTLVNRVEDDNKSEIALQLEALQPSLELNVDKIVIFQKEEHGRWTTLRTFIFRK